MGRKKLYNHTYEILTTTHHLIGLLERHAPLRPSYLNVGPATSLPNDPRTPTFFPETINEPQLRRNETTIPIS